MVFKLSQQTMKFKRFEKKKIELLLKNSDLNEATQGDKQTEGMDFKFQGHLENINYKNIYVEKSLPCASPRN